jgi:hypothetical protein
MKCTCGKEMILCKNGVTIGDLKEGIKMKLYKCADPGCNLLKKVKEKVKFN